MEEQEAIDYSVSLLEEFGPLLGRPHVDTVKASRYPNMKELRRNRKDARCARSLCSIRAALRSYLSVAIRRVIAGSTIG